jgi:FGGY-family pentulose kinase
MKPRLYLGIDVGTGSARAGLFDAAGRMLGAGSCPIALHRPAEDFVEQSSDDIWRACGQASRAALAQAGATGADVAGVGFDATCSLVLLDAADRPVTVSPGGDDQWNVIVWMDHRAVDQAARINARGHEVLRYVGGVISPEMETPKLLWLAERMPGSFSRAARFLDLADFLSYRATGNDARSLCTTACKWTFLGHAGGFRADYFEQIGLGALASEEFARIGASVRPMGERAGGLTSEAAAALGLAVGTPVAVSIIDAHAGGLGMLGAPLDGAAPTEETLEERVALIGGTSTCHMAVSREPKYVPGVWGPYFSAMVPGLWLTEGGQSATGALIDHTILAHARGAELLEQAQREGTTAQALLNARLDALFVGGAAGAAFPAELTRGIHVLPDHHGNRSPRADPTLRGMITGLKLSDSVDHLALVYLATIQAIALGTRHILEAMNAQGYRIKTIFASGGDTKNPVFLREHADATGCRVVLPAEPEAVLLGAAILGAAASGDQPSVLAAMGAMNRAGRVIEPAWGPVRSYFDAKYRVYHRLHDDQLAYRALMAEEVR